MNAKLEQFIDYLAAEIKADDDIPGLDALSDFRLKSVIRDALAKHVEEELLTKHTLDLTALVVDLAKLKLAQ